MYPMFRPERNSIRARGSPALKGSQALKGRCQPGHDQNFGLLLGSPTAGMSILRTWPVWGDYCASDDLPHTCNTTACAVCPW